MATYGSYETVGRIFSIGARSVYSARSMEGGKKDAFVVKVLALEDVLGEDPEVLRGLFVARASVQSRLTEAKARAWVGAYEQGVVGGEVFYVTDRVPSTAQQLISGKVRLSHADLMRVVSRVLEGLRELRATCGRAHANLKPSNVLIESGGDIAAAKVVLTDPSGAEDAGRAEAEFEDVRALGDLIHQLVLNAPFRVLGGYPVAESAAWTKLGKSGEQWRALVNRLLDPAARPGSISIEQIAGEVGQFKGDRGGGGGRAKPLAIGAVALVLLAGGAYVGWMLLGSKGKGDGGKNGDGGGGDGGAAVTLRYSAESWSRWCLSSAWAKTMRDELANRRTALAGDAFLSDRLIPLLDDVPEIDARSQFGTLRRRYQDAAQNPPEEVQAQEVVRATQEALRWIESVESVIWDEQWPVLRTLRESGDRLRAVGLGSLADTARERASEYLGKRSGEQGAAGQERDPASVARILDAMARVSAESAAFEELLASLPTPTEGTLSPSPGLRQVANRLLVGGAPADEAFRDLARYIQGTPDAFVVTIARVDPVTVVPDPVPVVDIGPDPRGGGSWDVPARLAQVRARLGEEWTGLASDAPAVRAVGEARAAVGEAEGLVREAEGLEWTAETRERVRDAMTRAGDGVSRASSAIDQARSQYEIQVARAAQQQQTEAEAARAHASFVEEYRGRVPEGVQSEFLRGRWERLREEQLARFVAPSSLADLRTARADLERHVGQVEGALPSPPGIEQGPAGFDRGALAQYLSGLREREIEALWAAGEADGFGDGFARAVEERRAALTGEYDVVRRYARDMGLAGEALAAQRGWTDPLTTGEGGETLAGIAARWGASGPGAEVVGAMGEVPGRLASLGTAMAGLERVSGREELGALIADPGQPMQVVLGAWAKLPEGEGLDLEIERRSVARLGELLGGMADQGAAQRLRASVEQESARRWRAAMERARTRAEYVSVLEWRDELAPSLDVGELPARVSFNIQLLSRVAGVGRAAETGGEAELRAAMQRILDLADAPQSRGVWAGDAATSAWVESIRSALAQQSSGPDLRQLGPASAGGGWTYDEASSTPTRAVFRLGGATTETIEFVRLDPGDGLGQAVYLSTTEVSIRLFNAAANAGGLWARVEPLWGEVLTETSWSGPRTWRYAQRTRLTPNSRWLELQGSVREELFAPGVNPGVPTDLLPVQHITAPAASEFARGLGCRLPTSVEWRAARSRFESAGTGNLRDSVWQTQNAFVGGQRSRATPPPFLDEGIFLPAGRRDIPIDQNAQPATSSSDGALYFVAVETGSGTFKNLIGNVAEFVSDGAGGGSPSFGVIGGSALSPPQLGTDEVHPHSGRTVATATFSDVGFRLAFDAGSGGGGGATLAQQWSDLGPRVSLIGP